jgi:hypothetical protein
MGLQNMDKIEQKNTAVNILETSDGKSFTPILLNCTEHLKEMSELERTK